MSSILKGLSAPKVINDVTSILEDESRAYELQSAYQQAKNITKKIRFDNTVNEILTEIELLVDKYNIDKDSFQVAETEVKNAQRQLEAAIYGLDEIFLNAAKVQEDNLSEEDKIQESYSANDIADELLDRHSDLIRRFGHEVVAQTILNVAKEYPAKSINELIEIIKDKLQTKNEGQIYSTGGGAGQSYRKYKAKPAGMSESEEPVNLNDPRSDGWRVYKVKSAGTKC